MTHNILRKEGFKFVQIKGHVLFGRGDKYEIAKIQWWNLKESLGKFNQTWHKAFLCKGDSSLFKWRMMSFSKGRSWYSRNSNLLQNDFAIFNLTWHKASVGKAKKIQGFTNKNHSVQWVFSYPYQCYHISKSYVSLLSSVFYAHFVFLCSVHMCSAMYYPILFFVFHFLFVYLIFWCISFFLVF